MSCINEIMILLIFYYGYESVSIPALVIKDVVWLVAAAAAEVSSRK